MPTRCAGLFGLPNAHVQCSLWKHRLRTTGLIAPEAEDTLEVQQKCAVGSAFGSIWQSISFLSVTPTVFKKNPVWSTKLNQGNRGLRYAWRHGQLEAGKTCFVANGCDCWGWILLYWLPIFSESLYKLLFSTLKPDLQTFFFFFETFTSFIFRWVTRFLLYPSIRTSITSSIFCALQNSTWGKISLVVSAERMRWQRKDAYRFYVPSRSSFMLQFLSLLRRKTSGQRVITFRRIS